MEHLVRIYNERDRQTLGWLRMRVGDASVVSAIARCPTPKPFVSAVCRQIGVRPPYFHSTGPATTTAVGAQSLAMIRGILAKTGSRRTTANRAH
ncbi:hypothetical protein FRZ40_32100 [Paraburkholderia azotifigens]|uniref:Uncharacterized protein n=1 Tax=Paraburkholderia azotifigens TaxID=2057004 RepID=A0A5C6VA01_9BURK|nr:hypothetical protein FRZ40_32100 [Paraburkholderia azotifigens]